MRAVSVTELGRIPEPGEAPHPVRREGEALVEVFAAALNPIDIAVAAGRFYDGHPPLPYIPGSEAIGRVVEAETLEPGTIVWAHGAGMGVRRDGGLAERLSVTEEVVVPIPEEIDPALACALGIPGVAAWLPLTDRAPVEEGETVLILGVTGTIGALAVQLARRLGAGRIVGAGRRPDGLERARRLGADAVVSLETEDDLATTFKEACDGDGPTLVLDMLWGRPIVAAATAAAPRARLVNVGQSAGPEAPFLSGDVRGKLLSILGYSNFAQPHEVMNEAYLHLLELAQQGAIEVELEKVPLDRVSDAWQRQADGAGHKLVIVF
jgi:NADPH:quinone reductase